MDFAGSDEGAENCAMLASLIETCKLHSVNPEAYLTDVLTKLVNNWPNSRLGELLPWSWTPEARHASTADLDGTQAPLTPETSQPPMKLRF
jgi:hypothetical protein